MNQAIRPNNFSEFSNLPVLQLPTEDKEPDTDQVALVAMSKTKGWKVFSKIKDRAMEELDETVKSQMSSGANFELIGQSTVVKELAKDVIRQLFNRVEDARESADRRGSV